MDKNKILEIKFLNIAKYSGIVAAISFVLFLIINAFNTGSNVLFIISYVLLMVAIVGAIQGICLFVIGNYFGKK